MRHGWIELGVRHPDRVNHDQVQALAHEAVLCVLVQTSDAPAISLTPWRNVGHGCIDPYQHKIREDVGRIIPSKDSECTFDRRTTTVE